tara:strand:+ start:3627 stop:3803 length:177 start_codon:yes stop_codon:yes gene_type:complete
MSNVVCPICESSFESELSSSMPFCSERCQKIDLGRWFEEDYSLPIEGDPEALDGPDQA